MKKYIFIAALFLGTNFQVSSQSLSQKRDSLKIDSIKKLLPQLKGTQRIESMFLLCEYYTDKIKNRKINAADTIRFYGNEILNESKLIRYKRGIAMGILASAPDSLKEKSARQAMQIGEEIRDEEILGWAQLILNSTVQDGNVNTANQQLVVDHFNKAGKILQAAYNNTWLGDTYNSIGENEKAFDCARKNLEVLKTIQSPQFAFRYQQSLLWTNWTMSNIFSAAGDYTEALKYMNKTSEIDKADDLTSGYWTLDISGIYAQLGKYDSALMYWNRCCTYDPTRNDTANWKPGTILSYNYLADLYIGKKQYGKAIEILKKNNLYFDSLIKYFSGNYRHAGYFGKMEASLYLGKAYDSTKNYKAALQCSKDGLNIARRENRRPEMMQGYRLLSSVHHHLGNNDSAYEYLIKYYILKDSIESKQFLLRIYSSKKDAEVEKKRAKLSLLDTDNKLKTEQLKQESQQKNFLLILLFALVIAGIFVYRTITLKRKNERLRLQNELTVHRLQSEKKQAELKRQASDLQMQALRAQMNPHFIFNSLSSINWFIMENDKDMASDYLTRFSRLMRMVLNAQKPMIPLEDELKMLQLYLDMERLRLENSFDYSIIFTNSLDAGTVSIPPMLLQPFCENAIWHGFKNKEGKGHILINIKTDDQVLECSITDDGIGRQKAAELKRRSAKKENSMGLAITRERLALFTKENNAEASFQIEDLVADGGIGTGTKVVLKISYKELIEEPV